MRARDSETREENRRPARYKGDDDVLLVLFFFFAADDADDDASYFFLRVVVLESTSVFCGGMCDVLIDCFFSKILLQIFFVSLSLR